eukprot:905722-Amphidinium_carterae.1
MVAVLLGETNLEQVNDVLSTLVSCEVGCPSSMPAGCSAAVGVGRKGHKTWYTTHAAENVAMVTLGGSNGESAKSGAAEI